ncbi:hypothetical protein FCI23_34355 [Actinacidiphila oryziradicis]|uniref:Uncharacterized protein n=2 Tax=Actinacidiphila oryziradicis TaxID=2571141 RepID=A0A4V5MYU5_9ACTN|nr:hypothetical protein FCI23_34355 [Actinacidiphila oryziradicis]
MWLAGVRHINLDNHCLETFGQSDRAPVNPRAPHQRVTLPAENPPLAWYLCALPHPWDWASNAHLAFDYAEGHQWEGPALVPGLHVALDNARPITGWASIPSPPMRRTASGTCTGPAATGSSRGGCAPTAAHPTRRQLATCRRPTLTHRSS